MLSRLLERLLIINACLCYFYINYAIMKLSFCQLFDSNSIINFIVPQIEKLNFGIHLVNWNFNLVFRIAFQFTSRKLFISLYALGQLYELKCLKYAPPAVQIQQLLMYQFQNLYFRLLALLIPQENILQDTFSYPLRSA